MENVQALVAKAEQKAHRRDRRDGQTFLNGCQTNAALISCSVMKLHEIKTAQDLYNRISTVIHVTGQVCSMTWNRKLTFLLKRLQSAMFCL